jgi:hypothetical protein
VFVNFRAQATSKLRINCERIKHAVNGLEKLNEVGKRYHEDVKPREFGDDVVEWVMKSVEKAKKEKLTQPCDIIFTNLTPEEREGNNARASKAKLQGKISDRNAIKNKLKKACPAKH